MSLTEFIVILGVMALPVLAIAARHQQKMAMIFQQNAQSHQAGHDARISAQIAELKELVMQQSLAIDDLNRRTEVLGRKLNSESPLQDRFNA